MNSFVVYCLLFAFKQMKELLSLEKQLGHTFKNKDLLQQSIVHRSYINEHSDFKLGHNERLEFLGDAVLEIIITECLYNNYPDKAEGELTNWRASLVNSKMLSRIADELELDKYILLSKGESSDANQKARQYILANAVEAIIGAIFLDQGIDGAKKFVKNNILSKLDHILTNELFIDPKSKFQEKAQEVTSITPHYSVLKETGPDHDKIFEVGLFLANELVSKGEGNSKQDAQMQAALEGLKVKNWN